MEYSLPGHHATMEAIGNGFFVLDVIDAQLLFMCGEYSGYLFVLERTANTMTLSMSMSMSIDSLVTVGMKTSSAEELDHANILVAFNK